MTDTTSRGPRGARGQVRERLLEAAREQFSTKDFSAVTARGIAEQAGVDPGLISYYFGGKTGIFRESMSLPHDPTAEILAIFDGPLDDAGRLVIEKILGLWEQAEAAASAKLLMTQVLGSDETLAIFRNWIDESLITAVAQHLSGSNRRARSLAAVSQVMSMLAARYLVAIEPLASMSTSECVNLYGPLVQHLLTPGRS